MKIVSEQVELLGTVIELKVPEKFSFLFPICIDELRRIEHKYSRFLDHSTLNKLNAKLNCWQQVDDEFFYLLTQAQQIKRDTKGHFDITLKQRLEELGYDKDYSFNVKKTKQQFSDALKDRFLDSIKLDSTAKKVYLRKEIEIGGFGKGFAVDQVAKILDENGVDRYFINAGGDIYAKGEWDVYLEHPYDNKKVIGKTVITDQAIASSSPSRRSWKGAHHLLNAKTKQPQHSIAIIFIIAQQAILADACATALFSAGYAQAIEMSRQLPIQVCIYSQDGELYTSEGFSIDFVE